MDIIDKLVAIMTNPSDTEFIANTLKEFQLTLQSERSKAEELQDKLNQKELEVKTLNEEKSRIAKAYHDKWQTDPVSTQTKEPDPEPQSEEEILKELKQSMEEKLNG